MQAAIKFIYFFKILSQSQIFRKRQHICMPRQLWYQKCVHINNLTADLMIANIQLMLIKLSMSQNATFNLKQTAELQHSAVEHPIRIIRGSMQENHIVTISFTALKYTRYHITYLPKVGIDLPL